MSPQSRALPSQSGISSDMAMPGSPLTPALTGAIAAPMTRPTTARIVRRRERATRNLIELGSQDFGDPKGAASSHDQDSKSN